MKYAIRLTLAVCFLAFAVDLSFAQSTNSGDIRGVVLDVTGAAVPDVTVTVVDTDTGETREFTTNESGIYDTVSLRPGTYTVTFSKPGFKKVTHGPVVLQVNVIAVDATLDVGRVTEVITVEDTGAPLLQTETSHIGAIQEAEVLEKLPQIGSGITGNDWANFNILLPGASGSPTAPMSEGKGRCRYRAAGHSHAGRPGAISSVMVLVGQVVHIWQWQMFAILGSIAVTALASYWVLGRRRPGAQRDGGNRHTHPGAHHGAVAGGIGHAVLCERADRPGGYCEAGVSSCLNTYREKQRPGERHETDRVSSIGRFPQKNGLSHKGVACVKAG